MNLFQKGDYRLASGERSWFKIDCDALTTADLTVLAELLSERVEPFSNVYGVPTGGLRLASLMREYVTEGVDSVLVVDDVWTTGGTIRAFEKAVLRAHDWKKTSQLAVLFARTPVPMTVRTLFQLTPAEEPF